MNTYRDLILLFAYICTHIMAFNVGYLTKEIIDKKRNSYNTPNDGNNLQNRREKGDEKDER